MWGTGLYNKPFWFVLPDMFGVLLLFALYFILVLCLSDVGHKTVQQTLLVCSCRYVWFVTPIYALLYLCIIF